MKHHYINILKHFETSDPRIHKVMLTLDFDKWLDSKNKIEKKKYFQALCRVIIGQQLSGKAASTIYKRLEKLLSGEIKPEIIMKLTDQNLRDVGISWAKAKYIKDLAQKVYNKELNLKTLDNLEDQNVIEKLTKVKGIGKWTAEMFLMFSLRREDIFSFGDLGLKNGVTKIYGIENPTPKQITKIIKNWTPFRSYGSIALWHSLE